MYCRLSTCLCVKQVSGPRSVFRLPESGGNDATEELASALAKYKNTSKQIHNIVNGAFLNKGLSLSQCYRIVETVKKGKSLEEMKDQRNKNPTKTWRTVEDRVLGHKLYQSLAASSLQSRFGSCRLFSLLENKEWPGWCFYHPWDLKTELERVLRSIGENEFTGAFQRWLHCHEKCIALQGGSVEKS